MNSYLGPLRRFWWLVLAAVPVAILAGLLVIYQVQLSPPGLTERHKPSYQATVQVLVTTRANPYLKAEDSPTSQALLDAANYLPFIVQSDRVSAIRTKRFGKINGEVTAEALYARVTTNRGLRPSSIPIMEVHGTAPTPKGASKLATTSVASLITWLAAEQQKAKVGRGVRVKLEALQAPRLTVQQQKSTGLALLVFSVVLLGFLALAWMLDRVFPADAAAETPAAGARTEPVPESARAIRAEQHATQAAAGAARRGATLGATNEPASPMPAVVIHSVDGGSGQNGGPTPSIAEAAEASQPQPAARKRRKA